jgi:hypothetical protein
VSSHDVERAFVQARLDHLTDRFDQAREAMAAEVDRLRESWSSGAAQQLADHEQRMRQMRDDQAAWLRSLYNDGPDDGADMSVGQVQGVGASAGPLAPASSADPGPGQPARDAAELAADDIKTMSMQEYAARRAELGVRSGTDMSHLLGH